MSSCSEHFWSQSTSSFIDSCILPSSSFFLSLKTGNSISNLPPSWEISASSQPFNSAKSFLLLVTFQVLLPQVTWKIIPTILFLYRNLGEFNRKSKLVSLFLKQFVGLVNSPMTKILLGMDIMNWN